MTKTTAKARNVPTIQSLLRGSKLDRASRKALRDAFGAALAEKDAKIVSLMNSSYQETQTRQKNLRMVGWAARVGVSAPHDVTLLISGGELLFRAEGPVTEAIKSAVSGDVSKALILDAGHGLFSVQKGDTVNAAARPRLYPDGTRGGETVLLDMFNHINTPHHVILLTDGEISLGKPEVFEKFLNTPGNKLTVLRWQPQHMNADQSFVADIVKDMTGAMKARATKQQAQVIDFGRNGITFKQVLKVAQHGAPTRSRTTLAPIKG